MLLDAETVLENGSHFQAKKGLIAFIISTWAQSISKAEGLGVQLTGKALGLASSQRLQSPETNK